MANIKKLQYGINQKLLVEAVEAICKRCGHVRTTYSKKQIITCTKCGRKIYLIYEGKKIMACKKVIIKGTKPERFLQFALLSAKINFKVRVHSIFGRPDFFIEPNLCVFVDGIYWHKLKSKKKRDKKVNEKLLDEGYDVLRFTDSEVLSDLKIIVKKIKNHTQTTFFKYHHHHRHHHFIYSTSIEYSNV